MRAAACDPHCNVSVNAAPSHCNVSVNAAPSTQKQTELRACWLMPLQLPSDFFCLKLCMAFALCFVVFVMKCTYWVCLQSHGQGASAPFHHSRLGPGRPFRVGAASGHNMTTQTTRFTTLLSAQFTALLPAQSSREANARSGSNGRFVPISAGHARHHSTHSRRVPVVGPENRPRTGRPGPARPRADPAGHPWPDGVQPSVGSQGKGC